MKFQIITDPSEIDQFTTAYTAACGYPSSFATALRDNYAPNATLIGLYDTERNLIGGYATAPWQDSRTRAKLPKQLIAEFEDRFTAENIIELNLVWVRPDLQGKAVTTRLWMEISLELGFRRSQQAVVFQVQNRRRGVKKLYRKIVSGQIWEGDIQVPGTGEVQRYTAYWSSRRRFACLPLLYAADLLSRSWNERSQKTLRRLSIK